MDLIKLSKIAIEAALAAGSIIQNAMNDVAFTVEKKESGTSLANSVVTEVDKACENVILKYLLPTCHQYDLALLSEETEDDRSRFEKEFFWCIDPMDGTLSFIQKRPGFSVAIALVSKNGAPLIGVVFDPSTNTTYHAIKGQGAFKNNKPWQLTYRNHLTYVTDRQLKDTPNRHIIQTLLQQKAADLKLKGINEIHGAGSVLNAIYVLENAPACMLKLPKKENGGGSIWDFAATACIYHELGLNATDFEGNKLELNKKTSTFMNEGGVFFASFPATANALDR